jgi:hypothetical protein
MQPNPIRASGPSSRSPRNLSPNTQSPGRPLRSLAFAALLTFAGLALAETSPGDKAKEPVAGNTSDAAEANASPDLESTAAKPTPAAAPLTPAVSELAAYVAAVDANLGRDPAMAAAYTVFWSELRAAAGDGKSITQLAPDAYAAMKTTGTEVASAVRQHFRGTPPKYAMRDALRIAVSTLAHDQAARADGRTGAERLLANIDHAVAPLVKVDGRYEYAGDLQRPADLGFAAEVWLLCSQTPACREAHDELFAPAMAGVGVAAPAKERVARDAAVAATPQLTTLLAAAAELDVRLKTAGTSGGDAAARDVAGQAARDYWRAIALGVPVAGQTIRSAPATTDATDAVPPNAAALQALFTLGRAGALIAGQDTLANAFTVTRTPVLDFASTLTPGALLGSLGSSVAGVGLLFAGVQALALFDDMGSGSSGPPPDELRQLVVDLNEATYRSLESARASQTLATNAVDTRVAALGVALDVVKTDVARLESASRRRVGSDFHRAEAKRWSAFDEDNERCFSLRNRDTDSGRLRANEFRRCEDRFLQGATRRSQYATRASEYVLDARFIEPGDPRFPFHDHYPLLAVQAGADERAALALADPLDWQQHTAALLRLYQENPAGDDDHEKRREALASVRAAGERSRTMLLDLTLQPGPDASSYRADLHRQALDHYFAALEQLVRRVERLDDPDVHPYGKRLTTGLAQQLPGGQKRAAIEAAISGAATHADRISACAAAPDSAFEPQPDRLLAESRRFFGDPVQPAELTAAWNRNVVNALGLRPDGFTDLVPAPYVWGALEGLGTLEFCFAQFRPEAVAFTRDAGPVEDTLHGSTLIGAELEVRFLPDPAELQGAEEPVVVALYSAGRACTFGYSNEEGQACSRAACLPNLAQLMWSDDGHRTGRAARCESEPMTVQLPRQGAAVESGATGPLIADLERALRAKQAEAFARLEADALRSDEYEDAAASYLRYYAFAGVTLGTYPGDESGLGGLFGENDPLTPRSVLQDLVHDHRSPADVRAELKSRAETIRTAVADRGAALAAVPGDPAFPHFRTLDETLARLELAEAAYGGG